MKAMWDDFLNDLEGVSNKEYMVNQYSKNLNDDLADIEDAIKGLDIKKALAMLEELRRYV